jgi:hypothetical protein
MPYKNPEARRARSARYYQANKHKWPSYAEKKNARTPEQWAEIRKRYDSAYEPKRRWLYSEERKLYPWLNSLRNSKTRAKTMGIPFDLTRDWVRARWTGRCEITGIEFVLSDRRTPYLFSPSLDRIAPEKGYTQDNCRFVIHAVNALKGAGTDEQMLSIAKAIVENFKVT